MTSSTPKPRRSISLPSRLSPDAEEIEAQLNKLNTNWRNPRQRCMGMVDIQKGLSDLVQLYNSTEQLFQSPSLFKSTSRETVDDVIDGSVEILDTCNTARELLLKTKEGARALRSSLRRKDCSSIESAANSYVSFRKSARKEITKRLRALKATQRSHVEASLDVAVRVMRDSSSVAVSILRCLFVLLSEPVRKSKASGWGLVSKLVRVGSPEKEDRVFNEVGSVDSMVVSLLGQLRKRNDKNIVRVEAVQRRLEYLDGFVDGLESGLDSLFRCLLQRRVCLLNLLTY